MLAEPMSYQDQSALELRLNLLEGELDLGQFQLLRVGQLASPGLRVQASIIGASHVICLAFRNSPRLHEVLACGELATDSARHFSARVSELPEPVELSVPGIPRYRFCSAVHDSRRASSALEALERRVLEAAHRPDQIGLHYSFPGGAGVPPPRTLVWAELESTGQGVRIETAHSYPNECVVVLSQTRAWVERSREVEC